MSANSKIEWTDHTWNPVRGCTRISEGCRNCYAERFAARFSRHIDEIPGPRIGQTHDAFHGFAKHTPSGPRWTGNVALVEDKLTEPLRKRSWKGKRVFVNSMSDLFHESLTDAEIDKVFAVMALCPDVTFQVLTKRAERMRRYFKQAAIPNIDEDDPRYSGRGVLVNTAANIVLSSIGEWDDDHPDGPEWGCPEKWFQQSPWLDPSGCMMPWPPPNVWLGVSVEDQKTADERIPHLLETPAAVRFVSYEPALGPVDFTRISVYERVGRPIIERAAAMGRSTENYPSPSCWWVNALGGYACSGHESNKLDWIIAGGESGPGARPSNLAWFRHVRRDCEDAGVPFFFKQWGNWVGGLGHACGFVMLQNGAHCAASSKVHEWGEDFVSEPVGKKAAGRLLDGREHSEFPK